MIYYGQTEGDIRLFAEVKMGIIKNRTTLNGEVLSLVANSAVGQFASKENPFDRKFEGERNR